jgi:hypothetical protein
MGTLLEDFGRMRIVSGKICRENITSQFIFNNLFLESSAVFEIMWKTRQVSDDYMAHGLCMLHTKNTLRIPSSTSLCTICNREWANGIRSCISSTASSPLQSSVILHHYENLSLKDYHRA